MRGWLLIAATLTVGCSLDLDALRAPPGDAGQAPSDAGAAEGRDGWAVDAGPERVVDAGPVESPTCGFVGLPCCLPGARCETGACLRGTCARFGGAYGSVSACVPDCQSRNPYTAGCNCPVGFQAAPVLSLLGTCDAEGPGMISVTMCTASAGGAGGDWAGAFVEATDDCETGCVSANPRTGDCSCGAGARAIRMHARVPSSCGGAEDAVVTLCRREDVPPITFGGAWQRSEDGTCSVPNPANGSCACGAGEMDQVLPVLPVPIHVCLR